MSHSSKYQITIKSANQKVDDYVTDCESNWTVKELKQHISETHVNKPKPEDQRLIYAGNLLKNVQTLEQIFLRDSLCTGLKNSSKTDFTIHLVCAQKAIYNDATESKTTTSTPVNSNSPYTSSNINSQSNNNPSRGITRLAQMTTNHSNSFANNILNQQAQYPGGQNSNNSISARPPSNTRLGDDQQAPPINSPPTSLGANAADMFNNILLNATGNGAYPAVNIASFSTTSNQHSEIVHRLMQSEQMRQQLAVFEQMANLVAAQIVNLARINSGNLPNNTSTHPITINANTNASTILNTNPNPINLNLNNDINNINNNNINNNNNNVGVGRDREAFGAHLGFEEARQNRNIPANPIHIEQNANFDVADWVFCSFKAVAIIMMIFLHASVFRIISTLGFIGVGYVFNRIRARRAHLPGRNQPQQAHQDQQPLLNPNRDIAAPDAADIAANDNQQAPRAGSPSENDNNEGANEQSIRQQQQENQQQQQQNDVIQRRIPFIKFCYLVVADFLASLLP